MLTMVLLVVGSLALSAGVADGRRPGPSAPAWASLRASCGPLPAEVTQAASSLAPSSSALTGAAQSMATGVAGIGVALVVTIYLLLDDAAQWRG